MKRHREALKALRALEGAAAHYHDEYDCGDSVTAPGQARVVRQRLTELLLQKNALEKLAGTLLCELGRVPDPRLKNLRAVTIQNVAKGSDRAFSGVPKPLTRRQAMAVLAEYERRKSPT